MIHGTKGSTVLIATAYPEWDASLYPRVKIYNASGVELGVSPKDLTYVANGYYYNSTWIPSTSGYYQAVFLTYTDSGFTTSSQNYGVASDTVKIDDVKSNIDWISSQIALSGGSLTANQIWTYSARELTGDTQRVQYISSQVTYISSASEKYGYGGGGGIKSYVIPGGSKSPWTHQQRDDIIKNVKDTRKIVKAVDKKMTKYHEDEMKEIDSLIRSLEVLYTNIKTTTKGTSNKALSEISYSIKVLKENRDKLKNINKDVESIYSMTSMLLSDEMIEEQEEREKKNE